eukprot:g13712.t1
MSSGLEGGTRAEFCVQHAQEGKINAVSEREFFSHSEEGMTLCMTWDRRCRFTGIRGGSRGAERERRLSEEADGTVRLGSGLSARLKTRSVAFGDTEASMAVGGGGGGSAPGRTKQPRLTANDDNASSVDCPHSVKEEMELDER